MNKKRIGLSIVLFILILVVIFLVNKGVTNQSFINLDAVEENKSKEIMATEPALFEEKLIENGDDVYLMGQVTTESVCKYDSYGDRDICNNYIGDYEVNYVNHYGRINLSVGDWVVVKNIKNRLDVNSAFKKPVQSIKVYNDVESIGCFQESLYETQRPENLPLNDKFCPNGYLFNTLKCASSLSWCESENSAANRGETKYENYLTDVLPVSFYAPDDAKDYTLYYFDLNDSEIRKYLSESSVSPNSFWNSVVNSTDSAEIISPGMINVYTRDEVLLKDLITGKTKTILKDKKHYSILGWSNDSNLLFVDEYSYSSSLQEWCSKLEYGSYEKSRKPNSCRSGEKLLKHNQTHVYNVDIDKMCLFSRDELVSLLENNGVICE